MHGAVKQAENAARAGALTSCKREKPVKENESKYYFKLLSDKTGRIQTGANQMVL